MRTISPFLLPSIAIVVSAPAYATTYLTIEQAQQLMFPQQVLSPLTVTLTPEQVQAIEQSSGVRVRQKELRVWRASSGGVMFVDDVVGKHDFITYAVALNADGSVKQIEILDYRESRGGEIRNARWEAQFVGKKLGDALRLNDDIQNISGATLSSEHVAEGVRRLLATYAYGIKGQM